MTRVIIYIEHTKACITLFARNRILSIARTLVFHFSKWQLRVSLNYVLLVPLIHCHHSQLWNQMFSHHDCPQAFRKFSFSLFLSFSVQYPTMVCKYTNWAVTWDFQQCGILTWMDSDKPVQSPFKLRNSNCCSVSSLAVMDYSSY